MHYLSWSSQNEFIAECGKLVCDATVEEVKSAFYYSIIVDGTPVCEQENDIDLRNCRGQGYDNGANMAGIYRGAQAIILEKNPQAIFSPCNAHSLNLCGVHAAESSPEVKSFFENMQKLYKLFSSSPAR